jgi:hypothetical protein
LSLPSFPLFLLLSLLLLCLTLRADWRSIQTVSRSLHDHHLPPLGHPHLPHHLRHYPRRDPQRSRTRPLARPFWRGTRPVFFFPSPISPLISFPSRPLVLTLPLRVVVGIRRLLRLKASCQNAHPSRYASSSFLGRLRYQRSDSSAPDRPIQRRLGEVRAQR